ncbi:thiamine pyrophosphate-binding protein [Aureimonas mangrovi]|uniref:thiamine pyrophosphate-binding protein n=1 Tax=Aureimonas mangrovi TaxID=2758041 RepID=UPI001FE41B4B|nr:thiamine pyrophosphate-binding protein [Aureimonas mangrovi]
MTGMTTGARLLTECLSANGVDTIFGVPGESFLAVLDALVDHPEMRFITTRHEGGASFAAEAHGKLTGRPGICFVTRGPGATNASIGLHTAQQDSTPMIVFIGQVGRSMMEREAFQEVDYKAYFGSIAKWVAQIDDARRIPEFVSRAFHTAMSGRPGPVVLALPEDMLSGEAPQLPAAPAAHPGQPAPRPADIEDLRERLGKAERPLVIAGGGGWSARCAALLAEWAKRDGLPVGTELRCQDYLDNEHPSYVGDVGIGIAPDLAARIRESDCIVLLGGRMGEMPSSGYTLLDIPRPKQPLVHIHPGAEELGRVYAPTLAIHSASEAFLEAVLAASPLDGGRWAEWTKSARAEYERAAEGLPRAPGAVDPGDIVRTVRRLVPDAIVTNGAGNYATWVHKLWRHRAYRTQLAPTNGAMGYGVPASLAAALAHPEKQVVCFAGDGCFMMTGQELATAVRHRLKILFLVMNNNMLGTIRMHQERHYPARVSATELTNPDFAAYARAFGAFGGTIEDGKEAETVLREALAADGPALVEVKVDPEALSIRKTLSEIRAGA